MNIKILIIILLLLFPIASSSASYFQFERVTDLEAEEMRLVLEIATLRLEKMLEVKMPDTIKIVIIDNQQEFDSTAGGALPDWGAGVAVAHRNLIVLRRSMLKNYPGNRADLLQHELAHIALFYRVKGKGIPRFLNEGFASWFAGEWHFNNITTIAGAQISKSLLSLREIDNVNTFRQGRANLAYSQSYLVIAYLFEKYGELAFLELLDNFYQGMPMEEAFQRALGVPFWRFEVDYQNFLAENYTLFTILSNTMGLWIILALVVIFGFIMLKKRKKDTIERWKEEEKLESTDFDYDESSPWD